MSPLASDLFAMLGDALRPDPALDSLARVDAALSGITTGRATLSHALTSLHGVADGRYNVSDAWDEGLSPYVVTIRAGKVVACVSSDRGTRFDLAPVASYLGRGFDLLGALSACAYNPDAVGNEDALGLGDYNG